MFAADGFFLFNSNARRIGTRCNFLCDAVAVSLCLSVSFASDLQLRAEPVFADRDIPLCVCGYCFALYVVGCACGQSGEQFLPVIDANDRHFGLCLHMDGHNLYPLVACLVTRPYCDGKVAGSAFERGDCKVIFCQLRDVKIGACGIFRFVVYLPCHGGNSRVDCRRIRFLVFHMDAESGSRVVILCLGKRNAVCAALFVCRCAVRLYGDGGRVAFHDNAV